MTNKQNNDNDNIGTIAIMIIVAISARKKLGKKIATTE